MKTLLTVITFTFMVLISGLTLSQSQNLRCAKFMDSNNGTIAADNGIIEVTSDAGATWTSFNTGYKNNLYCICQIDAKTMVSVGQGGLIIKSTDGYATWQQISSGTTSDLKSMDMNSKGNMISCGDNGVILISTDMGDSWTPAKNNSGPLNQVVFANDATAFAVGDNSAAVRSDDGGLTWNIVIMPEGTWAINFYSIAFNGTGSGLIVGDNNVIFESDDGGASWRPTFNIQGGPVLYNVKYVNVNDAVAVGQQGLIINISGEAVHPVSLGKRSPGSSGTADLYCVSFSDKFDGISVGADDTKLYTNDAGATWTPIYHGNTSRSASKNIKKEINIGQNYPNPFNPSTMISYSLPIGASVTLKIYDMLGKEVKTLVNGYQSAGTYNARFDGFNLSSGIYFYVFKANSGNNNEISKTMRMILTK